MLGKLIKYDFKALSRFLIIIHIMLLAVAVLGRVAFVGRLMDESTTLTDFGEIVMMIGILLFVLVFMAAVFGTLALVGIHFYRNLYSDEGYLTHTLPVSRGGLLASKMIAGSIWILLDEVLLILSVVILIFTKPVVKVISTNMDELLRLMGFPESVGIGTILLVLFVLLLVGAVGNAVTLYVSVAIGQLFSNHRVLGAIVSYVCINTVISIVAGAIGTVLGTRLFVVESSVPEAVVTSLYSFYVKLFAASIGFELISAIIFYAVTYWLMQKKLNLN